MNQEERLLRALAATRERERTRAMAMATGSEYDRKIANATIAICEECLEELTAADLDQIDTVADLLSREAVMRAYPRA